MKFVIDSKATSRSLHLDIAGFSIELSDIYSQKVTVIEDSGRVSIEALQVGLHEVKQEEPLSEAVADVDLFQQLVALRKQIAKEEQLPPYIIFHDTSLKDMVSKLPVDLDAMKTVSGVGHAKLEKYGSRFIEAIKVYLAQSA